MGTYLLQLPDECLCMILSFLRPSQVRRVALTFNRRLFKLAVPFLEPLARIRKDEAYFESLFGKMHHECGITEESLKGFKLTDLPISKPPELSDHLEYLDLKDDLSWFEAFTKDDDGEIEGVANPDGPEVLEELIKTTTNLGLELPASFVKLVRSNDLLARWPTCRAWYIMISSLLKMRKKLVQDPSRHEDGYIFTWFSDQQGCGYTNMYLDTAGRHAILGSDWQCMSKRENEGKEEEEEDKLTFTEIEKREGIEQLDSETLGSYTLEDVNFERWLAKDYHSERSWFLNWNRWNDDPATLPIPDHMRRHFLNVYTEEGRSMQR